MSPIACNAAEPIPGYTIQDRIGTGGYGEVWRAEVPGGLTKAVKFVYGYLNDERAASELKALSRIREVRHPFLLSLERIEVVDGQLIIVTELADGSLKDRFEACKASGATGIPRAELLLLLGDAADALDFMREHHSLQHLDVKPENLLLLGGRVKVADFGLVKDVYATGASLMGGMTPIYSSPEAFDGRPSRHSDQYSLAIVFQEMLTGVLPFSGRTAAQLAKQHTSSLPRLAPLPATDQPVIARALAKDPEDRFPSCRALIESLRRSDPSHQERAGGDAVAPSVDAEAMADTATVASKETQPTPPDAAAPWQDDGRQLAAVKTVPGDVQEPPVRRSGQHRRSAPVVRRSTVRPAVRDLPAIEPAATAAAIPPTLLLGVGGTGARTLSHVRRRLHDRFGNLVDVPSLQLLLLDTDSNALVQATRGEGGAALIDRETLAIPLRRPQEYRHDSSALLTWLSRRWLYNIPRSLQTEGLRPLGRLAFVDHGPQILARIRQAIMAATDSTSVARSAEQTGAPFGAGPPRVVIVSSISGGTGSGMVLDVAYAVRQVLAELGLPADGLCGVLAHSTSRQAGRRDLAITNAHACLAELYTFTHADGFYPGDPASGLAPVEGDTPTFQDTYLVHLGDDLTESQYDTGVDALAEYVYLDAVTSARTFFDQCRQRARGGERADPSDVTLRTFGLCRMGSGHGPLVVEMANTLCRHVIARWNGNGERAQDQGESRQLPPAIAAARASGDGPSPAAERVDQLAHAHAVQLRLDFAGILQLLGDVVHEHLNGDPQTYFRTVLEELNADFATHPKDTSFLSVRAIQTIDSILGHFSGGSPEEGHSGSPGTASLNVLLGDFLEPHSIELGAAITDWILHQIDVAALRVAGADRAGSWFAEHFHDVEKQARAQLDQLEVELAAAVRSVALLVPPDGTVTAAAAPIQFGGAGKPRTPTAHLLMEYATSRLRSVVLRSVCRLAQSLQGAVARTAKQIRDVRRELDRIGDAFDMLATHGAAARSASAQPSDGVPATLSEELRRRIPELAAQLDARFQEDYIEPRGGLSPVLTGNLDHRAKLPAALRDAARSVLRPALRELDMARLAQPSPEPQEPIPTSLAAYVGRATPQLLKHGGARRLLLVLPATGPETHLAEQLARQTTAPPSVAIDPDVDITLCCEAEQLSLVGTAAALIADQPDLLEIAARLHTRVDVEWSKIAGHLA